MLTTEARSHGAEEKGEENGSACNLLCRLYSRDSDSISSFLLILRGSMVNVSIMQPCLNPPQV